MNIVIISYSYTGNNTALADCVARDLSTKHIKVSVPQPFTMGTIVMDMLFSRIPKVTPPPEILGQYDLILLFGPVWMGHVASPLRAYLKYLNQKQVPYGFLSISGGADGGNPKLSAELLKRTGRAPAILLDQHIAELISTDTRADRKETAEYKIKEADIKLLSKQAISHINKIL